MSRHWHPTLERIVRWLKPSAESFAAAGSIYSPGLMLQLKITQGAVGGERSPECDGRSREVAPRGLRVVPSPSSRQEAPPGDRTPALGQPRPAASDRTGWPHGPARDPKGAQGCPV